jgi:hypothetical protein
MSSINVQWKSVKNIGEMIAGGNGEGNRGDQLDHPTDIIVNKQHNSLIIFD